MDFLDMYSHTLGRVLISVFIVTRIFLYKSELSRHIVTHTGDNPYNHTDFDNALSEIANITKQLEIYARNDSYNCSFCNNDFLQSS